MLLADLGRMIRPAVMALGEDGDGIDVRLGEGSAELVRIEARADARNPLGGVEVEMDLTVTHGSCPLVRSVTSDFSARPCTWHVRESGSFGRRGRTGRRRAVDREQDRRIGRVASLRGLVDGDVVLLRSESDDGERRGVDIEQRLAAEALDYLDGAVER